MDFRQDPLSDVWDSIRFLVELEKNRMKNIINFYAISVKETVKEKSISNLFIP